MGKTYVPTTQLAHVQTDSKRASGAPLVVGNESTDLITLNDSNAPNNSELHSPNHTESPESDDNIVKKMFDPL